MSDSPCCELCFADIDRDEIAESLDRLGCLACHECAADEEEN